MLRRELQLMAMEVTDRLNDSHLEEPPSKQCVLPPPSLPRAGCCVLLAPEPAT